MFFSDQFETCFSKESMCVKLVIVGLVCICVYFSFCSVFEGYPIPYPKREFLTDDEEDKGHSGASKVCNLNIRMTAFFLKLR